MNLDRMKKFNEVKKRCTQKQKAIVCRHKRNKNGQCNVFKCPKLD